MVGAVKLSGHVTSTKVERVVWCFSAHEHEQPFVDVAPDDSSSCFPFYIHLLSHSIAVPSKRTHDMDVQPCLGRAMCAPNAKPFRGWLQEQARVTKVLSHVYIADVRVAQVMANVPAVPFILFQRTQSGAGWLTDLLAKQDNIWSFVPKAQVRLVCVVNIRHAYM